MMNQQSLPRINLKRAYEAPASCDGVRILVERLWPRGVARAGARLDHWFKDLAPSTALRRWYDHRPERWPEFRKRYRDELNAADADEIGALVELCRTDAVTFVFAARDEERNSAVVLREFILDRLASR